MLDKLLSLDPSELTQEQRGKITHWAADLLSQAVNVANLSEKPEKPEKEDDA
jgi:hypothetical protein